MKLIFCIDKEKGLMFNGRRQSQDQLLREHILEMTKDHKLYMSEYSYKQFENMENNIIVDDNFLEKAGEDDFCFVENTPFTLDGANTVILYNWNRLYPSDISFEYDLKTRSYKRKSKTDIVGNSHKKITEEIYVKE